MSLSLFRNVFQDIPECRKELIECLSGGSLIALRRAIGFWLSTQEKTDHLSLLNDVFENMNWTAAADKVTIVGQGLDFRSLEARFGKVSSFLNTRMVPFIVLVRAPVRWGALIRWTRHLLTEMRRSTSWDVTELSKKRNKWDARPLILLKGRAAGIEISILFSQSSPRTHHQIS